MSKIDQLEQQVISMSAEIKTITKNSTFLAKKAKMYDEEKNVAEKVPVLSLIHI